MLKMRPAQLYNAQSGPNTPKLTPETTPGTHSWYLLKEEVSGEEMEEKEQQKDAGTMKTHRTAEGNEEWPDVSGWWCYPIPLQGGCWACASTRGHF